MSAFIDPAEEFPEEEPGPVHGPGSGAPVDLGKLPPPPGPVRSGPAFDWTADRDPAVDQTDVVCRTAVWTDRSTRTAVWARSTVRRTAGWTAATVRSSPKAVDRWAWSMHERTAKRPTPDRQEKLEMARSKKDVRLLEEQEAKAQADAAERLAKGPEPLTYLLALACALATLAFVLVAGLQLGLPLLWWTVPGWPLAVLAGLVGLGLVASGWEPPVQTADRPADGPTVRSELNAEELSETLADCGAIKKGTKVKLRKLRPEPADQGGGWSAEVDFPGTTTLSAVMAVRDQTAAGLDTGEPNILWEAVPGYAGRGQLWVADRDPLTLGPFPSPLSEMAAADIFSRLPLGLDIRGNRVMVSIVGTHWLIGGNTGSGKSFTARVLVAGIAKDPNVQLIVADPQGMGIWSEFAQVGEYYEGGAEDPVALEALTRRLEHLGGLEKARRRRIVAQCRAAGTHKVRESKITPEIVKDRALRCPYIVVVLDEAQNYFQSPTHGTRIKAAVMAIIKELRAFGVTVVMLSQKPTEGAIPTDIRDIATTRLCLQAPNTAFGTAVLGEGFRSTGADPTGLVLPEHCGAGYLWGMGGPGGALSTLLRSDFMDDDDASGVLAQAYRLRLAQRPELLPERPTDMEPEPEEAPDAILGDLLECFAAGEDFLPRQGLLDGLARLRPEAWAELTWAQLKERLTALDVEPDRARAAGGRNPVVGLKRSTVAEAIARHREE